MDELRNVLLNDVRIFTRNYDILPQIIERTPQFYGLTFNADKKSSSRAIPYLINLLLRKTPNENGREILLEKCRQYYADNSSTLEMIAEFERNYQSQNAIWWYTRDTFLYRFLNKALRAQDIDMLINLHFFIFDLNNQISLKYKGENPRAHIERYYRGQTMTLEEIQTLQNIGSLHGSLTLNSFFSTTADYQTALIFAGSGSYEKDDELQSVVFAIQLLPSYFNSMEKEYADITNLSSCPSEQETLFTINSMLFLDSFQYDDKEKTWFINLTNWSPNDCASGGRYDDTIHSKQQSSIEMEFIDISRIISQRAANYCIFDMFNDEKKDNPSLTYDSLLATKTTYYDILLKNSLIDQFVYDVGMGSLAFMSEQIDVAAEYLLRAQKNESETHHNNMDDVLLVLYDTLGHIHREKCEYKLALLCYNVSLEIESTSERLDDQACIYKILGDYVKALSSLSYRYERVARACDKSKDFMANIEEWKLFVDYTSANKNYLSKYCAQVTKEYIEIGKKFAGISSDVYLHTNENYHLKTRMIPGFYNKVPANPTNLQVAIDCFQRALNICREFKFDSVASCINSAEKYLKSITQKNSN